MIASACFTIVCGPMNLIVMAYFLRRKLHNVSKKNRIHLQLFLITAVSLLWSVQAIYQVPTFGTGVAPVLTSL